MNRLLSVTSILLLLACTPPGATLPPKPAEPFKPMVSLRPLAVSLNRGATQMFQAEVNYPEGTRYLKQPVAWSVVEPDGGTITAAGLYTAPATAGTFHVQVIREDFPGILATATVLVK